MRGTAFSALAGKENTPLEKPKYYNRLDNADISRHYIESYSFQ